MKQYGISGHAGLYEVFSLESLTLRPLDAFML